MALRLRPVYSGKPPRAANAVNRSWKVKNAPYNLPLPFIDIETYLGDQRIGKCELCQCIHGDGELADAENSNSKLRDREDAACKLPDSDDAFCRHRDTVRAVLEGNMKKRQPEESGLRFVFETITVPFVPGGIGCSALRTGYCLLGNLVAALSTWFHIHEILDLGAQKLDPMRYVSIS